MLPVLDAMTAFGLPGQLGDKKLPAFEIKNREDQSDGTDSVMPLPFANREHAVAGALRLLDAETWTR